MSGIAAKDGTIDRLFRAHCRREGCRWTGEIWRTVELANDELRLHGLSHVAAEVKTQ